MIDDFLALAWSVVDAVAALSDRVGWLCSWGRIRRCPQLLSTFEFAPAVGFAEIGIERSAWSRRGLKFWAYSAGVSQLIRECGRFVL